ncbi:MAG: hypothetical protein K9M44_01660 [Candidatus Pacebacteria bacterium]|nr:hypothetical protein [Candidatus Paceibacterota bacterium]
MSYCPICGIGLGGCPCCGHRQTEFKGREIEQARIVNNFDGGAVFQGSGNSHFTFNKGNFHVTTEIPGLKQGVRINIRDDI